jgi:hypothetical protein
MRRLGTALGVLLAMSAAPVSAYSSFADYVRPIEEGGGGGHMFSGTPADGHSCDVCHRGAQPAPLEVLGLPLAGYVPGQTYELRFQWPATTPHVAIMAEFTDAAGAPAGITALAPYATWQASEKCEEGDFPAADVCRVGGMGSGCCRDLDPTPDDCRFPGERSVFWMLDCGSKSARVMWTAPATGDVWFSSGMVTSDLQNDARGDGSTLLRQRLRVAGASPEVTAAVGSCNAAGQHGSGGGAWLLLSAAGALCVLRRRY